VLGPAGAVAGVDVNPAMIGYAPVGTTMRAVRRGVTSE
jgi:hypothetical protein